MAVSCRNTFFLRQADSIVDKRNVKINMLQIKGLAMGGLSGGYTQYYSLSSNPHEIHYIQLMC